MRPRLTALRDVAASVSTPNYVPEQHGVGIVHIGVGAFHRAHQAAITDSALARSGGDWRIVGVSLCSHTVATELDAQNGLYTLLERGEATTKARVVAAIDCVVAKNPKRTLELLSTQGIKVVTLTVTEAGYGIDLEQRQPDWSNPVVMADIAQPGSPVGVLGLLTASLNCRRELEIAPFTVLCCDNLPDNGAVVRDGVVGFARKVHGDEVADWITRSVAFPSSMVDRITPAPTHSTYEDAARLTGCDDRAAVETEPFCQWFIEDNFPAGRPEWEAGGAIFVDDVTPYERMKLMMLNGCHSMLAYSGFLTGHSFVNEVMQNEHLRVLVQRHLNAVATLLQPLRGVDLIAYAAQLSDRFMNPAIKHRTCQIASDGTQKLPQRIFTPALEALDNHHSVRPFAFATAMWMRFCYKQLDSGTSYDLQDPRATEIASAIERAGKNSQHLFAAFHSMPGFVPKALAENKNWRAEIIDVLNVALNDGCAAAVQREAMQASVSTLTSEIQ